MDMIFAFEPFSGENANISKMVALNLDKNAVILPVEFDSKELLRQIIAKKPTRIIGIGRCRRWKLVRIERKATNFKEENGKALGKINAKGPYVRFSTPKIKPVSGSRISYKMDTFVCNYMLYSVLEFVEKNNLSAKVAFFHMPMTMDLNDAVETIKSIIE